MDEVEFVHLLIPTTDSASINGSNRAYLEFLVSTDVLCDLNFDILFYLLNKQGFLTFRHLQII